MRVEKIALFIFVLLSVFIVKCKKAHPEEAYFTSCPTSIKDGKPALVFISTSLGWQIWRGGPQEIICHGTFNWLEIDRPKSIGGHKNNGKEQWAFYKKGTKTVRFAYTCIPSESD